MTVFYYIYYNFYRLAKRNNSVFPPSFVALVAILALEIWLILSLFHEFYYFSGVYILPDNIFNLESAIGIIILVGTNTYLFELQDKGKLLIKSIEKNKNKMMVRIAWGIVSIIIINYWIVSLYLLSLKTSQVA